jgi:regulator of protease activity HflC (stomatin/prohibitin superfamily)
MKYKGSRLRTVLLAVLVPALVGCAAIEPGSLGVVTDRFSGRIDEKPLTPGFHFVGLFKSVYEFPAGVVDNINLDNFRVNTREGQEITVDIRVQYRTEFTDGSDKPAQLFKKYRKAFHGDNGLIATRWIPVIQQAAGYSFSQFSVIDLYQSRGAKAAASMNRILQNGLKNSDVKIDGIGDDFVAVETVAISDINLPDAIKAAVERKAQIEQETLSARQELEKSRMAAQKVRIEAQAEAEAKFIRAKGEANAKAAIGLSPAQYTEIERAKIMAEAIKSAPNLMVLPPGVFLDSSQMRGGLRAQAGQNQ